MRRRYLPAAAIFLSLAFLGLAGCGKIFVSFNPNPSGKATLTLSIRDTPPAGVALLSTAVTVTGAVAQPGNVSLLAAPVRVELNKLQTETLVLGVANVSTTVLNGVNLSLANSQLSILNNSSSAVAGCASGAVCVVRPRLTSASVFVPAALVLNSDRPIGLVLDFDLNRSLQGDLTIQPAVASAELVPLLSTDPLEDVNDFVGQVTSVGASQFALASATSGLALTARVDAFTQFVGFSPASLANDFTGVRTGQILAADLRLLANGTLVARRLTLEEVGGAQIIEGVVISTDAVNGRFALVVLDAVPAVAGAAPGGRVTVNLQPGAGFVVDNEALSVPLGASFASVGDLLVGQEVQARVRSVGSDASGTSIASDRVRLRMSQLTATVAAKSGNGLTLGSLSSLFTAAGISAIQVPASNETKFENVSGVASLSLGDVVSLRGLLFGPAPSPTLVTQKLRKR